MTEVPAEHIALPAVLSRGAPAAVLAALPGARAVGGVVRDALAGRALHDVDIAAPLPPEAIAARLKAAGLRVFETGLAHGTVTAVLDHEPVEVTSLRRDVLTDGRHAEVAWTTDWREDAARRDFTINAMSLSPAGALFDYFGGRADLAAGVVRFVGDPATRLAEDYLRALRYFRFQARYGRGAPNPAAVAAIRAAVPGLARLSAERVWMELKRLLEAPDPGEALGLMQAAGVLAAVIAPGSPIPAAVGRPALVQALVTLAAPVDALLRFQALCWGSGPQMVARRLKASGEELRRLGWSNLALPPFDASEAELRRALVEHGRARLLDHAWLQQAGALAEANGSMRFYPPGGSDPPHDSPLYARFRQRVAATPVPVFPLQGRDALAAGIAAGPEVGRLLAATRAWWLGGGCSADCAACLTHLTSLAPDAAPP